MEKLVVVVWSADFSHLPTLSAVGVGVAIMSVNTQT